MEVLTGGRQSGKNLYNALKLYNYIDSLQNDTTVRVVKKDGICVLCVDESISKEKVKNMIKEKEWALENYDCDKSDYKQSQAIGAWDILQKLLKESEE